MARSTDKPPTPESNTPTGLQRPTILVNRESCTRESSNHPPSLSQARPDALLLSPCDAWWGNQFMVAFVRDPQITVDHARRTACRAAPWRRPVDRRPFEALEKLRTRL